MNVRRIILMIAGVMTVIAGQSCDKLSDLLRAEVTLSLPVVFTIPASDAGDMIFSEDEILYIDLNEKILEVNNQLGAENIKSVSISQAFISFSGAGGNEHNNLTNISNPIIHFQTDAKREWTQVASWTGTCEHPDHQNLNVNTSQDWLGYFNSTNRFHLRFQTQVEKPITEEIRIMAEVKFTLKVSA